MLFNKPLMFASESPFLTFVILTLELMKIWIMEVLAAATPKAGLSEQRLLTPHVVCSPD